LRRFIGFHPRLSVFIRGSISGESPMNFYDKLTAASQRNNSLLCVGLDPTVEALPNRYPGGDRGYI
jgi:hypothetical protein